MMCGLSESREEEEEDEKMRKNFHSCPLLGYFQKHSHKFEGR